MKLPSLVKLPKHKRFEFRPRHYDPINEELQERVEKIKKDKKVKSSHIPNIHFERVNRKNKFEINLQLYLIIFMLFDLFLLFKVDDLSNKTWLIIVIVQVTAVYLKIRLGKKK